MVQLRQLERTLEQCLDSGELDPAAEASIEEYVEAYESIDSGASSRVHDMLVRLAGSDEPTPVFLEVLVEFTSCLVNIDEIRFWFRMCFPLATDSGGYSNRLVQLSRKFVEALIQNDWKDSQAFQQIAEWIISLYIDYEKDDMFAAMPWTNERRRFLRFNVRHFILQAAAKQPKITLDYLDTYLTQSSTRLDALEIASEFVSSQQQAKLYQVYDSSFFANLLRLLEFDKSSTSLTSAAGILAMLLPHIYDHVVELLPRLLGFFGRLCSWQPESENSRAHEVLVGSWDVLRDGNENGPNVIPLFTYLYGFFPRNTLRFCRQCDLYLSQYYPEYKRPFLDFWSRFMVFHRVETIVSHYLLHPLLLNQAGTSEEDEEISGADSRWQQLGSPAQISIFCSNLYMSQLVTDADEGNTLRELLYDHRKHFSAVLARSGVPAILREGPLSPSSGKNGTDLRTSLLNGSHLTSSNHAKAESPQMSELSSQISVQSEQQGTSNDYESAAFYARELFLSKNELDFANFLRYTAERKVVRLQKELANQTMAAFKREELEHELHNSNTRIQVIREEMQREMRSTRTIIRERTAYEGKLREKNHDLRIQLSQALESQKTYEEEVKRAQLERNDAVKDMEQLRYQISSVETELHALQSKQEIKNDAAVVSINLEAEEDSIKKRSQEEVESLQLELAQTRNEVEGLRGDKDREIDELKANIAQMQGLIKFMEQQRQHQQQIYAGRSVKEAIESQLTEENKRLKRELDTIFSECRTLDQELRVHRVHEEERVNELRQALMSSHPFALPDSVAQNNVRIRGRGGAQGSLKR